MDAAAEHFRDVVEPNAEEYLEAGNLGSRRHAFNAAISLAHMVEHLFEARKDASGSYQGHATANGLRRELYNQCPELELLVDVCNAAKHMRLKVALNRPPRQIASTENIAPMGAAANSSFISANDSFVPANAGENFCVVVVTFTDGKPMRALHPAVASVLTFWRRVL